MNCCEKYCRHSLSAPSCNTQLFGPHRTASRSKSIKGGNTCWLHVEHKGWPHVFIIARQDIAAGTELTIDYGEGCEKGI